LPDPIGERDRLVGIFRALGDPTRLDVYRLIAAQPDPLCVCDIVARFDVSQPTISHHLRILREAGLVTVSRRGVWAYYGASPGGLDAVRTSLSGLLPERQAATA
jgi:ArsR family transcriptional regulator